MAILVVIWIAGAMISYANNSEFDYGYSAIVLNRYLFFFILSCFFLDRAQSNSFEDRCRFIFESFLLLNNLLILIGFFFKLDIFSTYDPRGEIEDQRFGYKGLIHGGNDIAGIYILGIAYFFRENFKYKAHKTIPMILTCSAALLTGTKAGLLSVLGISIYYLATYRFKTFFSLISAAGVVAACWLAIKWNMVYQNYVVPFIETVESMDVLSYLMSSRNEFIDQNFGFIKSNWSWLNYITGDAFLYSETDVIDLYYFFGLGSIFYLYFYARIFFIRDSSRDNIYVFVVLIAIAATAGHVIQSTVVPLFLLLYIFSARTQSDHDTNRNNSHR
jgi:hypothetical protein